MIFLDILTAITCLLAMGFIVSLALDIFDVKRTKFSNYAKYKKANQKRKFNNNN